MHYEFTIPLEPVAKGRPRFAKGGIAYTPSKTRKAEQDLRFFLSKEFNREPFDGPVKVFARFTIQRPASVSETKRPHPVTRPDLDNYIKTLFDGANGLLFKDDAQVVYCTIEKCYGQQPSIYLHVSEVDHG